MLVAPARHAAVGAKAAGVLEAHRDVEERLARILGPAAPPKQFHVWSRFWAQLVEAVPRKARNCPVVGHPAVWLDQPQQSRERSASRITQKLAWVEEIATRGSVWLAAGSLSKP